MKQKIGMIINSTGAGLLASVMFVLILVVFSLLTESDSKGLMDSFIPLFLFLVFSSLAIGIWTAWRAKAIKWKRQFWMMLISAITIWLLLIVIVLIKSGGNSNAGFNAVLRLSLMALQSYVFWIFPLIWFVALSLAGKFRK